ncbi:MAG: hypothetical protein ACYC25_17170 [Paludibacter sp.]
MKIRPTDFYYNPVQGYGERNAVRSTGSKVMHQAACSYSMTIPEIHQERTPTITVSIKKYEDLLNRGFNFELQDPDMATDYQHNTSFFFYKP